jgi:hypothetical protein
LWTPIIWHDTMASQHWRLIRAASTTKGTGSIADKDRDAFARSVQ